MIEQKGSYEPKPEDKFRLEPIANLGRDAELPRTIREIEKRLFPEFENQDFGYYRENRGDALYFYFTPSHHFRRGLIDKEVLERLQKGENLISFGAGKAYLEQLLVKGLNVKPDQITLADKNAIDFPTDLKGSQFDMRGQWPKFEKKFDLAIFPESFTAFTVHAERSNELGKASELTNAVLELMIHCFEILNEEGEVRVDGHCLRDDELFLIGRELEKHNLSLNFNTRLFVARRAVQTLAMQEKQLG